MRPEARWHLAIWAYVAAQALIRLATGASMELDEAEAWLHGQHLAWGYGPQPPLYFWLQWAVFQVTGPGIAGLAVLKALLLGGTFSLLFALVRPEAGPGPEGAARAGAATLALGLLPQVVWESQRALTHSVLALMLAVALPVALRAALERGRAWHLAWGSVAGLGLLSKYNVAVWVVALLAVVVLGRDRRLTLGALGLGLLAALLVVAAPSLWMAANLDLATGSADKFGLQPGWALARVEGLGSLAVATLSFHALAAIAFGSVWLLGRDRHAAVDPTPEGRRLLLANAVSLGLVALGIVASGATEVKDRWLLPLAWPLAPVAALALWPALSGGARRVMMSVGAGAWLLAAVLLPIASLVEPGYRAADFSALRTLLATRAPVEVVTPWAFVAGNLGLLGEEATFLARPDDLPDSPVLLVLDERSGLVEEPVIAARTVSRTEVEVPRGRGVTTLVVLDLAAR